jgi:ABC-type transporter Mla subunit MlaD
MARSFTTELKVGLFTLATGGLLVFAWFWARDGLPEGAGTWRVSMAVASADGLYPGTPVKVAGVEVGSVEGHRDRGQPRPARPAPARGRGVARRLHRPAGVERAPG